MSEITIAPTKEGIDALRNSATWRIVDNIDRGLAHGAGWVGEAGLELDEYREAMDAKEVDEIDTLIRTYVQLMNKVLEKRASIRESVLSTLTKTEAA